MNDQKIGIEAGLRMLKGIAGLMVAWGLVVSLDKERG
jgi:hypothetical protein|uniref:Uncharacterized protein n=1 Tax=Leptospirillum sp. Group II '5-way CG' TaxID=419541 RepID=B6AM15_9BACT|nr:MAG: Hypothetical protein CGL2_11277160 [Leptospirillum sp. Group II '5-way CG']